MAHVTLQLGTGLTIPFQATRPRRARSVTVRALAWRRRALCEAQEAAGDIMPLSRPDCLVLDPLSSPQHAGRQAQRLRVTLLAAALLSGCAHVDPVPTDVAVPGMPNPEVALKQSMGNVAAEMAELGRIGPVGIASVERAEPVMPADLQRIVSFQWNGPLDQGVAKLAQSIGYTFTLTLPAGVQPFPVSINVSSVPAYQVFRTLGEQAGTKATVQVDILHHQVEVIYHV